MAKGKNIAYVRVSTVEQNEARQREALQAYNIDKWFIEKVSGKDTNRPQLISMLDFVREDDVVYIAEFSRLGRSAKDLLDIVENIEDKAAIAEFERAMILERQREGIAIAKKEGKYKGRKKIKRTDIDIHYDRYMSRKASKTQIANELGISRNTLTRLFNEYEKTLSGGD